MGFPTRACREPTSDDAMKQSLRLVSDVSLSMSWKAESLPAERRIGQAVRRGRAQTECSAGKSSGLIVTARRRLCVITTGKSRSVAYERGRVGVSVWGFLAVSGGGASFAALAGAIVHGEAACKQGPPLR